MKKLSLRAAFMSFLSIAFVIGLCVFCVIYFTFSPNWVLHPTNNHIYQNGEFSNGGAIIDRNGSILCETINGKRVFNEDRTIRMATLHAVGDANGFISSGAQTAFREELSGYNKITGLFPAGESSNDIQLTIDASVSSAALNSLGNHSGVVAIYNYKTGEILCMFSSPTYDPASEDETQKAINGEIEGVFMNRFLASTYAPGSTFKIVTAAAAIETLPDAYERTYTCKGTCTLGGEEVKCTGYHNDISLKDAFAVSCNCYFASLAVDLGKETMTEYARKFGFGEDFYLNGIKAQTSSYDVENARTIELGWSGIGQYTDMQNPLQYLTSIGAIANDGTPITPYFISGVYDKNGKTISKGKSKLGKTVCEATTAEALSQLMEGATKITYGGKAFFQGLDVRGKTGTAEWGDEKTIPHAEFIGFCADEEYPFAFLVVVEKGGSGNDVAKTVARNVLLAAKNSYDKSK